MRGFLLPWCQRQSLESVNNSSIIFNQPIEGRLKIAQPLLRSVAVFVVSGQTPSTAAFPPPCPGYVSGYCLGDCPPHSVLTMSQWITYAEAAELLGIKPESVKKRAIRRRWPRQVGNDGLARIQIPDGTDVHTVPGDITEDITGDKSLPVSDLVDQLRADLAQAREALARAEGVNITNEKRIVDLGTDRDRWQLMAERLSHVETIRSADRGGLWDFITRWRNGR